MDDEKLIILVQEQPIIYDMKRKDYKNVVAKRKVWEAIAAQLNVVDVNRCITRWRYLRDTYNREVNLKKKLSGSSNTKRKAFKHFDALSFLSAYSKPRETIEDVNIIEIKDSTSLHSYLEDCVYSNSVVTPPPASTSRASKRCTDERIDNLLFEQLAETNDDIADFFSSMAKTVRKENLNMNNLFILKMKVMEVVHEQLLSFKEY